ncbi:MAG: ribonuclease P protein component [Parvibaculales bacterium]
MTQLARLKVRREFLAVAKGHKQVRRGLVLQALARSAPDKTKHPAHTPLDPVMRYGLTASKKTGNAVARNRARRRLRALAEEILPKKGKTGFDYVLIARATTQEQSYASLAKDLESALKRVHDAASQNSFASVEEARP